MNSIDFVMSELSGICVLRKKNSIPMNQLLLKQHLNVDGHKILLWPGFDVCHV